MPEHFTRIIDKLTEAAIRAALGYNIDHLITGLAGLDPNTLKALVAKVAPQLADYDGVSYRCNICGKGPFTRKGLYLHIKRVHIDLVREIIMRELKAAILAEA